MKNMPYDTRSSEWAGDMTVWLRQNSEDNSLQLERLYRNLRQVRERELTSRQQQILELYYEQHLSLREIARRLGVHSSTVCRTMQRAKKRLRHYLQYTL